MAAFPASKAAEKQTNDPYTTFNYLNNKGIRILIVSVGRADHQDALNALARMGDSYSYHLISALGDSAAMALTMAIPKFSIKGGHVAELHVIKNRSFLNLAPVHLGIKAGDPTFVTLTKLVAEMAKNLP